MTSRAAAVRTPPPSLKRAAKLMRRNSIVYKHAWSAIVSGFFEPLFYLGAVGFGVGRLIGTVDYAGTEISYATFLAPGMLAASTLNGAIGDGFFWPFFKLNYQKTYDGILCTPMNISDIAVGEILWAQVRGTIYSVGFLALILGMGLIDSWWGLLALPAAMLSAGALSAGAMILTGITRQITAFDKVMNLIVFPMFLFSGTFFPVTLYPDALQPLVMATPLYHSASLIRALTTGVVGWGVLVHVAYLGVMFAVANVVAIRLLRGRLIA
ncbi:MAG TPA: ABC transporter permease [Actinomycetota bacterium]|nr:ABC transporter permease [Actinomycetota bacterium]